MKIYSDVCGIYRTRKPNEPRIPHHHDIHPDLVFDVCSRTIGRDMNDYPIRVKIVASASIMLTYLIGGPLFVLMYATGAWADRCDRRRYLARTES